MQWPGCWQEGLGRWWFTAIKDIVEGLSVDGRAEMKSFNWNKAELKAICISENTGRKSVAGEVAQI